MKQVEHVSVGGYAFVMEAEAAAAASAYLKELEGYYSSSEIMEGIEERMAELLLEKAPEGSVVDRQTVEQIIDILGRPERLEAETDGAAPGNTDGTAGTNNAESGYNKNTTGNYAKSASGTKVRKRLYRDLAGAKIGGVCSGLAIYAGVDVAIFRMIFLLLFLVSFFCGLTGHAAIPMLLTLVIYILLWIAMPAAKTVRQKWEQRGESGSVDDISRGVISSGKGKVGSAVHDVANAPVWGTIGRVLEVIIGLILLVTAVSGIFGGTLAIFGWQWLGLGDIIHETTTALTEEFAQFPLVVSKVWVLALAAAVYFLPFIGMLYGSIFLLFRFKAPSWHPGLWIFVLWLICIVAFAILLGVCVFSAMNT